MGLIYHKEWGEAKWIALSQDHRESQHRFRNYKDEYKVTSQAAGYFRDVVDIEKKIESARAYICGLGYYELYINGEKVGDHLLDPAPSNYDKVSYYVKYDVTEALTSGENALGIMLGSGFYGQDISWKNDPESQKSMSYGQPAAKLLIKVKYTDGTQQEIVTDSSWRNSTGPIVFDNIYGGETYDARYEISGWSTSKFNDRKWSKVNVVEPNVNRIEAQNIPPIRNLEELAPQRIFESPEGDWIIDFGKNIAGWVRVNIQGEKGQLINITPTEVLTKDGTDVHPGTTGGGANGLGQLLQYICKGGGKAELWEPSFTYHGFRYIKVEGLNSKPTEDNFTAVVVATDMQSIGSFSCSNEMYNKMDEISRWTIVGNMHGIPEDCPHREKCGWLGDAHAFCEYALYNYDLLNFYKKFMEDIRTQRKSVKGNDDSDTRYLVPTMIAPGKRESTIALIDWGVAAIYLPWYNLLHTGDESMAREYYEDMKDLTSYYLTFKDEQGIMQNGMGDWCPPLWDRKQNPEAMECHPVISANAYFYDVLGIMERFAQISGDEAFAKKMKAEQESLFEAFNRVYLEKIPLVGHLWYGSQTATVMALQFGMVPQDKIESVVRGLVFDIEGVKGTHHAVGIHGMRYIYTVLSQYGHEELAHEVLTTPTFPSQAYVVNYGFTTWPERQFYWDSMSQLSNSLNHPMHSGFAAFFYESLGGVKSSREAVGYKEFTVNPICSQSIDSASVRVSTSYGAILNEWSMDEGKMTLSLSVPFNTTARVAIDDEKLPSLEINGERWSEVSNRFSLQGDELLLGSGDYQIKY